MCGLVSRSRRTFIYKRTVSRPWGCEARPSPYLIKHDSSTLNYIQNFQPIISKHQESLSHVLLTWVYCIYLLSQLVTTAFVFIVLRTTQSMYIFNSCSITFHLLTFFLKCLGNMIEVQKVNTYWYFFLFDTIH